MKACLCGVAIKVSCPLFSKHWSSSGVVFQYFQFTQQWRSKMMPFMRSLLPKLTSQVPWNVVSPCCWVLIKWDSRVINAAKLSTVYDEQFQQHKSHWLDDDSKACRIAVHNFQFYDLEFTGCFTSRGWEGFNSYSHVVNMFNEKWYTETPISKQWFHFNRNVGNLHYKEINQCICVTSQKTVLI